MTGGAGFIGSHLCESLVSKGCNVNCFDNLSVGTLGNISSLQDIENFQVMKGDITDRNSVDQAVAGADVVFHLAARVGVKHYVEDPIDVLSTNFYGTHNVLEASLKHKVKRFIFGSTSEVYGRNPRIPLREDSERVLGPATVDRWSYSISKSAGEHLCNSYCKQYGLAVTILRYFNIYGPRGGTSDYGGVVSIFIRRVLNDERPLVHGTGLQTRCFTYVGDAVQATIRAAESDKAIGETINVGTSHETKILELAETIIEQAGKAGLKPKRIPHKDFYGESYEDIDRRVPSTVKLAKLLDFKPTTPLKEGLTETTKWVQKICKPGGTMNPKTQLLDPFV